MCGGRGMARTLLLGAAGGARTFMARRARHHLPPTLGLSIVLGTNEHIFHIWVITHQPLWLENRTPKHLTLWWGARPKGAWRGESSAQQSLAPASPSAVSAARSLNGSRARA